MILLSILLLVAIYSLYEGELETVVFDKKIDKLQIRYKNILCKTRFQNQTLSKITSIRACVRGRSGPNETVHYVICIFTENGEMTKVLFSKSEGRIKRQLLLMRKFLRIELDKPIAVVDMSTADEEVKVDLKTRIIQDIKKRKKPYITA